MQMLKFSFAQCFSFIKGYVELTGTSYYSVFESTKYEELLCVPIHWLINGYRHSYSSIASNFMTYTYTLKNAV